LEELAGFFNPLAVQFIRNHLVQPAQSGIDLGCGPGFTTNMLAEALNCPNIYGLDISDNFLTLARSRFKQLRFIKHDITGTPFPVSGEIIYGRLLLSHLDNIVALVNQWAAQLPTSGTLFIEEVEAIETGIPVFKKYLDINERLIASQGAELYAGKRLAGGTYDNHVICNECVLLPVPNRQAAAWFYPNTITIWETEQYVLTALTAGERNEISQKLLEIKNTREDNSDITWQMRRIAIRNERG
jgi:SAM-dependent methyltransferase